MLQKISWSVAVIFFGLAAYSVLSGGPGLAATGASFWLFLVLGTISAVLGNLWASSADDEHAAKHTTVGRPISGSGH